MDEIEMSKTEIAQAYHIVVQAWVARVRTLEAQNAGMAERIRALEAERDEGQRLPPTEVACLRRRNFLPQSANSC